MKLTQSLRIALAWLAAAVTALSQTASTIEFEFGSYRVSEGAGSVLVGVKRSDDALPATVDFTTRDRNYSGTF